MNEDSHPTTPIEPLAVPRACSVCGHPHGDHDELAGGAWCRTCMAEVPKDEDPRQVGPCF